MEFMPQDPKIMDSDEYFKSKFMEYVNSKANKVSNSFTITSEKRARVIRCLKNPQSEVSSKFRFWVRQKKFRLIQSEDAEGDIVGIPADEKDGDDSLYKRAACIEEFWDLINTAHVENGHIGLSQTYAAIRRVYALLPRCVVAKFIQLCPICRRTARQSYTPRSKEPPSVLPSHRLVDGGSIIKSELNQTITVVTSSTGQLEALGGTEIITDGTLPASAISSIIAQEGLSGSEVIHEITLNQTDDGQTVALVSEAPAQSQGEEQAPQAMETQTSVISVAEDNQSGVSQMSPVVIFNCHICNKQFEKKLTYQRHLRTHSEHNPTMPVVMNAGPAVKKIKLERKGRVASSSQRQAVILDVDMSVDCTQGVMLAVTRPDVDIQAITCVSGAVNIEHTCNNALRVLKTCSREDIPVFRGAEKPLVGDSLHSDDNLPGAAWETPADARQIEAEHAVSALIRFVNEYPGQITLICLGPLTNLALALRLDPQVARKLKDILILGGNIEGRGSATLSAEQNFFHDPEAAYIVLKEMTNITVLPYEVCQRHPLSGEFFYGYLHLGTVKSEFLRNSSDEAWLQQNHKSGYVARSAYAIAVALDGSVALEAESAYATVELGGKMSHGMMIVDWNRSLGLEANVRIVKSLDVGKVQSFLGTMVQDELIAEVYTAC
ncbi:uncharacterized protein LOC143288424 [Babylonia areolata]|uniref:uncharacterized protein LOC143288424 n=1 Tax=Babylonia areolata TaxID=304850 RepID=UPI003FD3D81D